MLKDAKWDRTALKRARLVTTVEMLPSREPPESLLQRTDSLQLLHFGGLSTHAEALLLPPAPIGAAAGQSHESRPPRPRVGVL